MRRDWRFWLGVIASLNGLKLYSFAHEIAARNWVYSVIRANNTPDGPPANVSHGWHIPTQESQLFFWFGLASMGGGVVLMIWSARRNSTK